MTETEIKVGEPASKQAAPGELELVRAFINTLDVETGQDDVATPAQLRAWLLARNLLSPRQRVTLDDVARAHAVREDLRALAAANDGDKLHAEAGRRLSRLGADFKLVVTFDGDGTSRLVADGDGIYRGLGAILAIVHHSQVDGSWGRLKVCAKDSCQWAFYDHSRNHSGTWCNMAVCGNRVKVARFRQRQARASRGT